MNDPFSNQAYKYILQRYVEVPLQVSNMVFRLINSMVSSVLLMLHMQLYSWRAIFSLCIFITKKFWVLGARVCCDIRSWYFLVFFEVMHTPGHEFTRNPHAWVNCFIELIYLSTGSEHRVNKLAKFLYDKRCSCQLRMLSLCRFLGEDTVRIFFWELIKIDLRLLSYI